MNVRTGAKIIDDVTRTLRCPWWLEFGGALGMHRDGQLMPWDRDVDIGVRAEHWPGMRQLVRLPGWRTQDVTVWRRWARKYVGAVHERPSKVRFLARGVPVAVHIWYPGVGEFTGRRWTIHWRQTIAWCPEQLADAGAGHMPARPEDYFEWYYGPGWRVPDPEFAGSDEHRRLKAARLVCVSP